MSIASLARAGILAGRLGARGGRVLGLTGRAGKGKLPPRQQAQVNRIAKSAGISKSAAAALVIGGAEAYGGYKDIRSYMNRNKRKRYTPQRMPARRRLKGMRPGYRKFRRVKRAAKPSKYIKTKKDVKGQITSASAEESAWFGVQAHGGIDEYVRSIAYALTRAICAKGQFYPDNFDDVLSFVGQTETDSHSLELVFRGVNPSNGDIEETTVSSPITSTTTFNTLVRTGGSSVAGLIYAQLKQGKSPHFASLKNTTRGTFVFRNLEISSAYIEIYTTVVTHLQNQTLAPGDGIGADTADAHNIHAQPLHGKLYSFNNAAAIARPELDLDPSKFQDEVLYDGIEKITDFTSMPTAFKHPQKAAALFLNCTGEVSVSLQPGQSKKHVQTLKFSGRLDKLIDLLSRRNNDTGSPTSQRFRAWGKVNWFCFERAIRHGTTTMEIAYNVEQHFASNCVIKPTRRPLTQYLESP